MQQVRLLDFYKFASTADNFPVTGIHDERQASSEVRLYIFMNNSFKKLKPSRVAIDFESALKY
jgi:hypothetical protein